MNCVEPQRAASEKATAHTCWCCRILRLFMVRTMAASMACRRSWSTFSITFRLSSWGGAGICSQALKLSALSASHWHLPSLIQQAWLI